MPTSRLSPERRTAALEAMAAGPLDVLVIGGGVVGAGTALDAASRGLTVGLVEMRDWASGTSSASSKLIHGGLRYLEMLDFRLVREALSERDLLLDRLAPHLVKRLPFLYPLHGHTWERAYVGAGLLLYDGLAAAPGHRRVLPAHRHLSRRTVGRLAPALDLSTVTGAVQYYDAQVDDARFVLTLVRTAAAYGTLAANRARAVDLVRDGGRVVGAVIEDDETGVRRTVRAKVVVAAAGVWTEDVLRLAGAGPAQGPSLHVRASKGIPLVVPRDRIRSSTGIITKTATSVLFVIPWGRHWILGTTDTPWDLELKRPPASARDIAYLLDAVNAHLTSPLTPADVEGCYAGLRPLLYAEGRHTTDLSREHAVISPAPGLVVVAGGKYTTYRVMARDAVDAATAAIGGLLPGSVTERLPLLGADGYAARWNQRHLLARQAGLHVAQVEHLLNRYGSAADEVLELMAERPELSEPVPGAEDYLAAELVYGVSHEGAGHLTDLLSRRTRIVFETFDRGLAAAAYAASQVAGLLGWDAAEVDAQVATYRRRIAAQRASETSADDATAVAALGTES
ncbi:MAG: glycerol-3-phosphate dehydrogenase/oxidase [Actinomycetes bacterium]